MLAQLKSMKGARVRASDGELGQIDDFYFSDLNWLVRYAVVDLGSWLTGKKVLIPGTVLGTPDTERKIFPVNLTREKVENSPDINWKKPVSREMETNLYAHFGWAPYWYPGTVAPAMPPPSPEERRPTLTEPHLRSANAVRGYGILAMDQEIGHLDEFVVDLQDWAIRYLMIDTSNWPGGKTVVIPIEFAGDIHWDRGLLEVRATSDTLKDAPEYKRDSEIDKEFENALHRHFTTAAESAQPVRRR